MKRIVTENFLIIGASKVISLLITLYFAKMLTKEDYGLYSYINLLILYLSFSHLGAMNGIGIELPKYINKYLPGRSVSFYISYFIFSVLLQAATGLAIFLLLRDQPLVLVLLAYLYFLFLKSGDNVKTFLLSSMKLEQNNIFRLFSEILSPLAALLCLYYYHTLESVFAGFNLVFFPIFLFSIYFLFRLMYKHEYSLHHFWLFIKKIYLTGFPIYVVWVMDMLFRTFDRFLLSQFYTWSDLADYSFAGNLAAILPLASASFISPYGQLLFKEIALNEKKKAHEVVRKATRYVLISCVVIAVLLVAGFPLVTNYIGKYSENYLILILMIPGNVLISLTGLLVYYMTATYRAKTLIRFQLLAFLVGSLFNLGVLFLHLPIIYFVLSSFVTVFIYFFQLYSYVVKDREKENF